MNAPTKKMVRESQKSRMDAYRKHLAAAEAYGARARAHRARAERHRSLAFGGWPWLKWWDREEKAKPVNDAGWTFEEVDNHIDFISGRSGRYASVARADGRYMGEDETGTIVIGHRELLKYVGKKWEDIPPHIQEGVLEGPPSVQEERKKKYDEYLLRRGATGTRP
jgi:hypothetical protein